MTRTHESSKIRRAAVAAVTVAALALLAGAAFAASAAARGPGAPGPAAGQAVAAIAPAASLTDQEKAALRYMREEELVAHDLYVAFAAKYGSVPSFARIATAETQHASAVKVLLDRYGLADPAVKHVAGTFSDPTLQALYDRLLAKGMVSLGAAADVGVLVEKQDIADLQARLAVVKAADVKVVFGSLLAGSQNHLRAFTLLADRF